MTEINNIPENEETLHTKKQYIVAKIASLFGYQFHIPKNDRNKQLFSSLEGYTEELPTFGLIDKASLDTIRNIDVIWLSKNYIVAGFEIEDTTSVISGILRLTDLKICAPNFHIEIYIIYPDNREKKVNKEINRPTFDNFGVKNSCHLISYSILDNIKIDDVSFYEPGKFLDKLVKDTSKNNIESIVPIIHGKLDSTIKKEHSSTIVEEYEEKDSGNKLARDFHTEFQIFVKRQFSQKPSLHRWMDINKYQNGNILNLNSGLTISKLSLSIPLEKGKIYIDSIMKDIKREFGDNILVNGEKLKWKPLYDITIIERKRNLRIKSNWNTYMKTLLDDITRCDKFIKKLGLDKV